MDGEVKVKSETAVVNACGGLRAEMNVPGDKSISHRSVMLGSVATGLTEVEGFLEGEDNLSTMNAFMLMGVKIEHDSPGRLRIHGVGLNGLAEPNDVIDAANSGTTARLLMGILSAQPFFSVITGDASLRRRPMRRVTDPLKKMGADILGRANSGLLPISINGGRLNGIKYRTPVASAQLKSAILFAGLYARGATTVVEPAVSRDHTERLLKLFGANITVNKLSVTLTPPKRLNGANIFVPGDISSAAFFMVGAMITPKSCVVIKDVGINPTRIGIISILLKMGGNIELLNVREVSGEPVADIMVKSSRLNGVKISAEELLPAIDEFPIICVAAAFAKGATTISGASELRVKESDRISVMAESLGAIGIECREKKDGIVIEGVANKKITGGFIESHGDHRIAMSMAMAGLRSRKGVKIYGSECVDVSFPGFFSDLEKAVIS